MVHRNTTLRLVVLAVLAVMALAPTMAESATAADTIAGKRISINLASRLLTVYDGEACLGMYPVGPGKISTPTPTGTFEVYSKIEDPEWIDPKDMKKRVPSGEANPLGYRWLGFYDTYGIHGTNMPGSIGWYVSNGCIRMYEDDVEKVFELVSLGAVVEIYYDRLIVNQDVDHTVSYYIYPDGYGIQPLDVAAIAETLSWYGVSDFESEEAMAAKLEAADGTPTVVGAVYDIRLRDELLGAKGIRHDDVLYLPLEVVAKAAGLTAHWDDQTGLVTTPFGQATGYRKKSHVYVNSDDLSRLFYLKGQLTEAREYELVDDWQESLKAAWSRHDLYPDGHGMEFVKALYHRIWGT